MQGADVRIRWLLEVVSTGGPEKLLKQDRELRGSLQQTDTQYRRTSVTAASVAGRQTKAAEDVAAATGKQAKATESVRASVADLNRAQAEALSVGSRVLAQARELAAAKDREAKASDAAAAAEGRLARARRDAVAVGRNAARHVASAGRSAGSAVGSGITGTAAAAGSVLRGGSVVVGGALLAAGDLTKRGLELGTTIRKGAAGLGGLTGLNPREATALALIAQVQGVSARGLGTSLATLGKQLVGFEKHEAEVVAAVRAGAKPPKANAAEEAFAKLGISRGQARALQGNLPGAFDLVYQRAQKLPAAERATVLKSFLGRDATLAGELSLGGPLSKQLHEVGGQLGGLDPRKLKDLHEIEIKLKLATDALELSFAAAFGPDLIKLFDAVAPAIKPIGSALHTAVVVPLNLAKEIIPGVFSGLKKGVEGHGISTTAGGRGDRSLSKETQLEQIGVAAGGTLRTIGVGAAKYGSQLRDAFKPAVPFFQNVLLPLMKGVGVGVVLALKAVIPAAKVLATVLGAIGRVAGPLGPEIKVLGIALGVMFAPKILLGAAKMLTDIPKIGGAFKLLVGPLKLANQGFTNLAGVAGKAIHKVGVDFLKLPSLVTGVAGRARGAGGKVGSALADGLSSVRGRIASIGQKLAGVFSSVFLERTGPTGAKAGESVASGLRASSVRNALTGVAGSLGRLVGVGIMAGIGFEIYAHRQEIAEKLKEILDPSFHGHKEGVNSPRGRAQPGSGFEEGLQKILHIFGRAGGRATADGFRRFQAGGVVPARVSPGEQVLYGGRSWIVPGTPTAADSVSTMLPVGASVLTFDGQARMAAGQSLSSVLATQAPHFAKGGLVVSGPASTFGPPGEAAAPTAYGGRSSQAGIALNPHGGSNWNDSLARSLAGRMFDVELGGHHGRLKVIDKGPSATGKHGPRLIDITGAGAQLMGINPAAFPTDSTGRATLVGGSAGTGGAITIDRLIRPGRREGLLEDAVSQGIEAGAAGASSRSFLKSVSEAVGTVTSTLPGAKSGTGKLPAGITTPSGRWNPSGDPIAKWIVPYLSYASSHGWPGIVTSGYRSKAQQAQIYNSGVRPAAKPGTSKHEGTQYPSGAVDVTDASKLAGVLAKEPGPHLLQWAGSRDPVHFSHPVGGAYRRGGVVGGAVGRALPQLASSAGSGAFSTILVSLDATLAAAGDARLGALRRQLITGASRGGTARVVKSYQAVISLIDYELGRRIGQISGSIEQRTSAVSRGTGAFERFLRSRAIDPASTTGLKLTSQADRQVEQQRRHVVNEAKLALHIASRTGNTKAIEEARERLTGAQEELDESIVKGLEDRRSLLRQGAQDAVDNAAFGVQSTQNALAGLDVAQRLNRTNETPGGLQQKASVIESQLIPALGANLAALNTQLGVLQNTGASPQEIQQEMLAIQTAGSEIGSAMAEAAEAIRQAAEQAAEELVEHAGHTVSLAQIGEQKLELEQRLNGSFEGGGQQRAAFIESQVLPALQTQLDALLNQQRTAETEGNVKLAAQIGEAVAQEQNTILQAQLEAQEDIRANTAQKPGGSLGFTYGNETLNDAIVQVGGGL